MSMKHISDYQVVKAVNLFKTTGKIPYETLSEETGQVEKVCFRCMERAVDRGLLDYGVSVRTSWLTESGEALLRAGAR